MSMIDCWHLEYTDPDGYLMDIECRTWEKLMEEIEYLPRTHPYKYQMFRCPSKGGK